MTCQRVSIVNLLPEASSPVPTCHPNSPQRSPPKKGLHWLQSTLLLPRTPSFGFPLPLRSISPQGHRLVCVVPLWTSSTSRSARGRELGLAVSGSEYAYLLRGPQLPTFSPCYYDEEKADFPALFGVMVACSLHRLMTSR